MSIHYRIAPEIFARFPGFRRGVVVAEGIRSGPSPQELVKRLRLAEEQLAAGFTPEAIPSHPRMASWREAFRAAGIKPADYRPSVEALVRRVVKKDPLPLINAVVDLGNLASIQFLTPVGAHATDRLQGDIELRLARGDEVFVPFGSEAGEHPLPGEIIFAAGQAVLTRRWTWRQSMHTLVTGETTAIEINVDALPPVGQAEVEDICRAVEALVREFCGGRTWWGILSRENPVMDLD